ncbi:MAG TPA: pitrilysin family protein [Phycisphaerae bacterium]|nr:pitrilysin family protein [Phycisphaerae bacterium]
MSNAMRLAVLISSPVVLLAAATLHAEPPAPYRLDNGLTVILRPMPTAKQTAVVVLFNLGGDHDPPGQSGRAHLLEHLYCTAAAGDTPARDFTQIQKRYAGGSNQQTGSDFTVLAGVVKPEQLAEELTDAAARMGALRITEADLKRERPRVLLELKNMYGGIPSLAGVNHVRTRLHPIAGKGQPGGKARHVKAITLDQLRSLWQDYYKPNNAVLVLAGKFDVARVRKLIQQSFGPIPSGKAPPAKPPKPQAVTGTTHPIEVKSPLPKATGLASVGYAAPPPGSKDYAPFLVVVSRLTILGQGGFRPGEVAPLYWPMLDDPTTVALQAPLADGNDAQAVLGRLAERLQTALTSKLTARDRLRAINSLSGLLGTADVPDATWARNPYTLAFSVGRRHQLKLDGAKLRAAIQGVTDADVQRLAKGVFSQAKRIAVIVTVQKVPLAIKTPEIIRILENEQIEFIATAHSQTIHIRLKDGREYEGKYVHAEAGEYSDDRKLFDILNLVTHIKKHRPPEEVKGWMILCE